jgi:hypothetical protein
VSDIDESMQSVRDRVLAFMDPDCPPDMAADILDKFEDVVRLDEQARQSEPYRLEKINRRIKP